MDFSFHQGPPASATELHTQCSEGGVGRRSYWTNIVPFNRADLLSTTTSIWKIGDTAFCAIQPGSLPGPISSWSCLPPKELYDLQVDIESHILDPSAWSSSCCFLHITSSRSFPNISLYKQSTFPILFLTIFSLFFLSLIGTALPTSAHRCRSMLVVSEIWGQMSSSASFVDEY